MRLVNGSSSCGQSIIDEIGTVILIFYSSKEGSYTYELHLLK